MSEIEKVLPKLKKFAPVILLLIAGGILFLRLKGFPVFDSTGDQAPVAKEKNIFGVTQNGNEKECSVFVDVGGAVIKPGVYCLPEGDRVVDAINMAGGFIDGAYAIKYVSRYLNMALPLKENQKVYIPYQNDLSCTVIPFALEAKIEREVLDNINNGSKNDNLEIDSEEEGSGACVNINTASKSRLMEISGVGESMSQRIMDGRPYKVVEDLKNVSGIGEATFEKFKPHICL